MIIRKDRSLSARQFLALVLNMANALSSLPDDSFEADQDEGSRRVLTSDSPTISVLNQDFL